MSGISLHVRSATLYEVALDNGDAFETFDYAQAQQVANRAHFDHRSTPEVALAPVLCVDCDTYVPAGWIDFVDSPKCPTTGHTHRVSTYVLTHVIDRAWNAMRTAAAAAGTRDRVGN